MRISLHRAFITFVLSLALLAPAGTALAVPEGGGGPDYATIFGSVTSALSGQGVNTNISSCASTPTACSGLYFEKVGKGTITFSGALDMTDTATIHVLQNLDTKLDISNGHIKLDALDGATASVLKNAQASIEMSGLDYASQPTLVVRDDSGTILTDTSFVGDIAYQACAVGVGGGGQCFSFNTTHFTTFDLQDKNVYVDASNTDTQDGTSAHPFATIQAAVAAAASGDTVHVAAGAYSGDVTISVPLTISASAGVNLTGSITAASDGVTLDGLDITNPNGSFGIYAVDHSNLTVTNNTIHDIGTTLASGSAQAIMFVSNSSDVTGLDVENNVIRNIGNTAMVHAGSAGSSAKGVYLGNSGGSKAFSDVKVVGNSMTGIYASIADWRGSSKGYGGGAGAYGILVNHNVSGLTITGNTIGTLEGLWAHGIGLERNTPSAVLSNNAISGLVDHKTPSDAVGVQIEDNSNGASVTGSGNTFDSKPIVFGNASVLVDLGVSAYTTTRNPEVLLGGSYYYAGLNAFPTIQAGVSGVAAGGTVNVAAGTYPESVLVDNKSLTLVGVSGTVITGASPADYILKINGTSGGATVDGIEINGGDSNTFNYGVLVTDSGTSGTPVELKNLTVKNVWGSGGANGIEIDAASAGGSYALVHNSTITSFQKRGIRFINSSGKVYGSEVVGDNVDGTSRVQNLINLWGGSNVEIYGNKLHNALTTGTTPSWDSPAIFISSFGGSGASTANIHDNEIYSNDTGITLGSYYASTDTSSATITSNTFHDLNSAINFEKGTVTSVIHKNSFGANIVQAVNADDGDKGPLTKPSVNAMQNWWGDVSGPTVASNPGGEGAEIYNGVSYAPWYSNKEMTNLSVGTPTVSGEEASTELPDALTQTEQVDGVDITVEFGAGTVITGNASWDGTLAVPTASTIDTVTIPGYTTDVGSAIAIGSSEGDLTFNQPVRITFAGQTGKRIGWYNHAGVFTEITDTCDLNGAMTTVNDGATFPVGGSCKFDTGTDMVVWTEHFSTFVTYTTAPAAPVITPNGGSFTGSASVTMDTTSTGASIRYTTDGSAPVCGGTGSTYTNGQTLNFTTTTTLKAIRCAGSTSSALSTATFTITPASSGGGGGGGGGNGMPLGLAAAAPTGQTATTGGQVLGAEAYNFTKNLTLGSQGDDVTELQKILIAEGYLNIPAPTGYFGALTKAAVIAYQKAHGISPQSGYVGALTRAELNKGSAPVAHSGGSSLSASQIQSVIALLQAFGVDAATIANVNATLSGTH